MRGPLRTVRGSRVAATAAAATAVVCKRHRSEAAATTAAAAAAATFDRLRAPGPRARRPCLCFGRPGKAERNMTAAAVAERRSGKWQERPAGTWRDEGSTPTPCGGRPRSHHRRGARSRPMTRPSNPSSRYNVGVWLGGHGSHGRRSSRAGPAPDSTWRGRLPQKRGVPSRSVERPSLPTQPPSANAPSDLARGWGEPGGGVSSEGTLQRILSDHEGLN